MKSLASAKVLAETKERLRRLTPEDRALWGKMSVTQMLRHLSCSYEVALADRDVAAVKGPPPWLMKFAALRTGLRWPKGTPTAPELVLRRSERWRRWRAACGGRRAIRCLGRCRRRTGCGGDICMRTIIFGSLAGKHGATGRRRDCFADVAV